MSVTLEGRLLTMGPPEKSCIFYFGCCILHLCLVLFIFSVKNFQLLILFIFIHSLPSSLNIFVIIASNSLLSRLLFPLHLALLLGFYLVLSFGKYSSVTSNLLFLFLCIW